MAKSKFEEKAPIVLGFLSDGYTNKEAAQKAGIEEPTFYAWLKEYPEFFKSVQDARKNGEQKAIAAVESSLLDLAKGFEYEEVTTEYESQKNPDYNPKKGGEKYIPVIKKQKRTKKRVIPSIEAIKFFLTNKAPDIWKNRQQQEIANLDLLKDLRIERVRAEKPSGKIVHSEDEITD